MSGILAGEADTVIDQALGGLIARDRWTKGITKFTPQFGDELERMEYRAAGGASPFTTRFVAIKQPLDIADN